LEPSITPIFGVGDHASDHSKLSQLQTFQNQTALKFQKSNPGYYIVVYCSGKSIQNSTCVVVNKHPTNSSDGIIQIPTIRKLLSVAIGVASDPVAVGDTQTIVITVREANSSNAIPEAKLNAAIVIPSERNMLSELSASSNISFIHFIHSKKFNGLGDDFGTFVYMWKVGQGSELGIYSIAVGVSAPGYQPKLAIKTFNVRAR